MHDTRPKNLNLFTIQFPIPAIVSILHRVTGAILFLLIPIIIGILHYSLTMNGFGHIQSILSQLWVKILIWLFLIPFVFHLIAGVRHLLSDIHIGDELAAGRLMSYLTFILTFIIIVLAGIWLW